MVGIPKGMVLLSDQPEIGTVFSLAKADRYQNCLEVQARRLAR